MKQTSHIFMINIPGHGFVEMQKTKYRTTHNMLEATYWKTQRGAKLGLQRLNKMAPKATKQIAIIQEKLLSIYDISKENYVTH